MNHRIKILAEQAGILSKPRQLAPTSVIQPGVLNPLRKYVSDEEYIQDNFDVIRAVLGGNGLEKFAELIVKQCAGVAEVSMSISSHPDDRLTVKNSVLKHFGVEE